MRLVGAAEGGNALRRMISAAGATLAATFTLIGAPPVHAQADPACRALRYQATQQAPDGSIGGDSDLAQGPTADTAIGMAAAGFDPRTMRAGGKSLYDYLASKAPSSATSSPGRTGRLILAVVAARLDPTAFGGVNLVTKLQGTYDSATGAFGDGATANQAFAILGLRAAGAAVPAAGVGHLKDQQSLVDHGWNFGSTSAGESDTNSTAMALMALAAAGDHAADAAALGYLQGQQNSDGGFPYQKPSAFGTSSDPDSDALVLQALVATGQDPSSGSWTKSGRTPMANLLSMQDASGGFGAPDSFTTSMVPAALVLKPYASGYPYAAGASLPGSCEPSAAQTGNAASTATPAAAAAQLPATRGLPPGGSLWLAIAACSLAFCGGLLALTLRR
jgi:hypothetical protein